MVQAAFVSAQWWRASLPPSAYLPNLLRDMCPTACGTSGEKPKAAFHPATGLVPPRTAKKGVANAAPKGDRQQLLA
jgi:hypothetical protein